MSKQPKETADGRNPFYEHKFPDEPDDCWRLRKELLDALDNADMHHTRLERRIEELTGMMAREREIARRERERARAEIAHLFDPIVQQAALRPPSPIHVCARCAAAIGLPEETSNDEG